MLGKHFTIKQFTQHDPFLNSSKHTELGALSGYKEKT